MGISHGNASSKQISLSPFGEACSRTDLTAIHEFLEKAGYKDDEGVANEVGKFIFKFNFLISETMEILIRSSLFILRDVKLG